MHTPELRPRTTRTLSAAPHVFVTVGSTKFDALVEAVLSDPVLDALRRKGYVRLAVQSGNSLFDAASFAVFLPLSSPLELSLGATVLSPSSGSWAPASLWRDEEAASDTLTR